MIKRRIMFIIVFSLLVHGLAYGEEKRDQCIECRMYLDMYKVWTASIELEKKKIIGFCCAKCLFKNYLDMDKDQRKKVKKIIVRHYKTGKELDAKEAFYAVGTDIMGPMGKALLPFEERSKAESAVNKHGGKVIQFKMIDKELMEKFLSNVNHTSSPPDS